MLASVPTREKKKPKSYTTHILIGFILVLLVALSGLASLYYSSIQSTDTVIVINQTPNETSNQTITVKDTSNSATKKVATHNTLQAPRESKEPKVSKEPKQPRASQNNKDKKPDDKSDQQKKQKNNT